VFARPYRIYFRIFAADVLLNPMEKIFLVAALFLSIASPAQSNKESIKKIIDENFINLEELYKTLHQHPELALHEKETSKTLAAELKKLNFEVFENIGGYGLAGVLKNGTGPTVLIRTDMDALPIEEKTGLAFASKAKGTNAAGNEVSVMHACGHDLHMSVFIGTARVLTQLRKQWKGTLVMIAQPAEETGFGADMMLKDGLYSKIPYPDYALALHNNATLPSGTVGYNVKNFMASVDMMNITVFGKGGHGAAPHQTVDPIVLSAQMIQAFQLIVSREINPLEPAVITVGSIHGGTVHNIIPDEVKLQLTLRSYSPEVREQIKTSIRNKAKHLALQAGLPEDKAPLITINDGLVPATINDESLVRRLIPVFENALGRDKVIEVPSSMIGEDFSRFATHEKKSPLCMFWLGTASPEKIKRAKETGVPLPSLHTAAFAPDLEPALKTGILSMSSAAFVLLK
jgi:amidohydrolase